MEEIEKEILNEIISNQWSVGAMIGGILLICFWFIARHFSYGYSLQKGKNLADKQDIEELTEKVENVKHLFTSETEKLKSRLELYTQLEFGHKSEIIQKILYLNKCFIKYWTWITNTYTMVADINDNKSISEAQIELDKTYLDFVMAEAELELFIEDQNLFTSIYEIKKALLEQVKTSNKFLIKSKAINSTMSLNEKYKESMSAEKFINEFKILAKEQESAHEDYHNSLIEALEGLITKKKKYVDSLKQAMQKVYDSQ